MRDHFEEKLDAIYNHLTRMGERCSLSVSQAVQALLDQNADMAKEVIQSEREVNTLSESIERECVLIVLKEQPVAHDLRFVTASLHMISDLERIGDMAYDISELVLEMIERGEQKKHLVNLEAMAHTATLMISDAVESYVQGDEDLARETGARDDVVDEHFIKVCDDIIEEIQNNTIDASTAVDLIMVSKYLERIGDHAQNISEQVLFSLTGEMIKFQ